MRGGALALAALALALAGGAGAKERPGHGKPAAVKHVAKRPAAKKAGKAEPDVDAALARELVHVVKPGETLGGIAARAKVPRVLIIEANHLKKPWHVHAGQKLKLPRTRHHVVAKGETGFDISYRYGVPFAQIAVANGISPRAALKPGQELLIPTILPAPETAAPPPDAAPAAEPAVRFAWPLAGKVRRGFTPREKRNYHDGIDIAADAGQPVRASDAGTVIFAGREPQSYGNLVVLDHGNGWQSAYGFLGRITVRKGDAVRRRERIGLVGRTGKATRDELHFEIRRANRPVDPVGELPAR